MVSRAPAGSRCEAFQASAVPSMLARMGAPVRAMRMSSVAMNVPPVPAISSAAMSGACPSSAAPS